MEKNEILHGTVKFLNFEDFIKRYQKVEVEEYPNKVLDSIPAPEVSVRISTYQHKDFISKCLDGVLNQICTFQFEILIGEDESNDGTREICIEYAKKYPDRIRLFLHKRENNIAINGQPTGRFQVTWTHFQARGKYIAECEGDDYWTDIRKLQKQYDFLESHKEYVICGHPFINIDFESGQILGLSNVSTHTLTRMYRNVIDVFPEPFFSSVCGDTFIKHILSKKGKMIDLDYIKPAVRIKHSGGMMSKKDQKIAYANTIGTKQMLLISYPDDKRKIKKSILGMINRYYKRKKAFDNGFLNIRYYLELIRKKVFFLYVYGFIRDLLSSIRRYLL